MYDLNEKKQFDDVDTPISGLIRSIDDKGVVGTFEAGADKINKSVITPVINTVKNIEQAKYDLIRTGLSNAMEGTGKLLFSKDNKPAFGMSDDSTDISPVNSAQASTSKPTLTPNTPTVPPVQNTGVTDNKPTEVKPVEVKNTIPTATSNLAYLRQPTSVQGVSAMPNAGKNGTTLYSNVPNEPITSTAKTQDGTTPQQRYAMQQSGNDNNSFAKPAPISQLDQEEAAAAQNKAQNLAVFNGQSQAKTANPTANASTATQSGAPYVQSGRLVVPQIITPPAQETPDKGFTASPVYSMLNDQNKQEINELINRNLQVMRNGTGNMSNALAYKYANKSLKDIFGKDTADIRAQQEINNQAQQESQYKRSDKRKGREDAWSQLLQANQFNYGVGKDQQAMEARQTKAQADAAKARLDQYNKDREFEQKDITPVKVGEKINPEILKSEPVYMSPSQYRQQLQQQALATRLKNAEYYAKSGTPEQQKAANEFLNQYNQQGQR